MSHIILPAIDFKQVYLLLTFVIDSIAFPISANANPVRAIISPGGIIHHQSPRAAASEELAWCRICPHVGIDGSPSPKKLSAASVKMAEGTARAMLANVRGNS